MGYRLHRFGVFVLLMMGGWNTLATLKYTQQQGGGLYDKRRDGSEIVGPTPRHRCWLWNRGGVGVTSGKAQQQPVITSLKRKAVPLVAVCVDWCLSCVCVR